MSKPQDRFDVDQRLLYLRNIFIFGLALLVVGLSYFQLVKGDRYVKLAASNRLRMIRLMPPRGNIFDATGIPLGVNVRTFDVKGYPMDIQKEENLVAIAQLFSGHGIPMLSADLKVTLDKQYIAPYRAVSVATNLTLAQVADLVTDPEFPSVLFPSPVWRRVYPTASLAAHVVGYVGEITRDELEEQRDLRYEGGDIVGKNGIEAFYEDKLRGTVGEEAVEVDARGRRLKTISYTEPIKGSDVHLTLDLSAQRFASELMKGYRGAIVGMRVEDGAVDVLYSSPSYDPNPLTWGISAKEWALLLNDKERPMMNRTTSGVYPPGSTFKIVTAMAALTEGTVNLSTTVHCPGYLKVGNQTFRCWKRSGHGTENIVTALRDSCDVYFYQVSLWMGADKLLRWAQYFGAGSKTGIDIPGELPGNLAGREWKRRRFNEGWYHGDTVNYSIGQGYLLTTPLQIARMFAAIANGGRLVVPRLNKEAPVLGEKISFSKAHLELVQRGLTEVVRSGTGRPAGGFGVSIAGKTGTAQNAHGDDHAWFVGYAPVEKPKYVVVALVEAGKAGSSVAGPIVGKMLAHMLNKNNEGGAIK